MDHLTRSEQAVLLAVAYAEQRWTDASRQDVIDQLDAPRIQSGLDLLPLALTADATSRLLAKLRGHGLAESLPAIRRGGRCWAVTDEGRTVVAAMQQAEDDRIAAEYEAA